MGHSFTNLLMHGVWSTSHRRPLIHEPLRESLWAYVVGIARKEFGDALRVGGTADHLHGLFVLRADVSVAHAVSRVKSVSSGWMRRQGVEDFAWQEGYAAFSVSRSAVPRVAGYIENQAEHHRRRSFRDELAGLLERHGIEFDVDRILL